MAYLSAQAVKEIRNEINKVLTSKDGFKISVTRANYSGVNVNVMQSPLKFSSNDKVINEFSVRKLEDANERLIFQLIDKAVTRITGECIDYNANDHGADYCNYNFYKNYRIGKWDQECKFI